MKETEYAIDLDSVPTGTRRNLEVPIGTLPDHTPLTMRVEVLRGVEDGPSVFLSGCIHGDELNGFEIIRRVVDQIDPSNLRGRIVAVPIVNVFGFLQKQRYLPDRRDLNRVFPGSKRGSQAARLANGFMQQIVAGSTHGIDLHTGPIARFNFPQIRGDFEDPEIERLAHEFCAPVGFHARPREGTIRRAAGDLGVKMLLFEGGEAMRFDRHSIHVGVAGILRVLKALEMIVDAPTAAEPMVVATKTRWVRAKHSGVLRRDHDSGESVTKKQALGTIGDALADQSMRVISPSSGLLISHATSPLVNEGDAIYRVANIE